MGNPKPRTEKNSHINLSKATDDKAETMYAALFRRSLQYDRLWDVILGACQAVLARDMVIICMQVKNPSLGEMKSFVQRCYQCSQFNPNVTDVTSVYQGRDVQEESKMLSYLPDPCPSLRVPGEISPGSVSSWHGYHRERGVCNYS